MGWSSYDAIHNTIVDPEGSHARSGTNAVQMWGRYPGDYSDNVSGLFQDRPATNAPGSVNFDDAVLTLMSGFDQWITNYFAPNSPDADTGADPDGDHRTNAEEYRALTNPADATSVLLITLIMPEAGGGYQLVWNAVEGIHYRILATSDLGIWNPGNPVAEIVATGLSFPGSDPGDPAETGSMTQSVPAPTEQRFYRVEVISGE